MIESKKFLDSLTDKELVSIYEHEYLPFKFTGVLPKGKIRMLAQVNKIYLMKYDIDFAVRMYLEKCAEKFISKLL